MKKNVAFLIYSLKSGGAERVVSTLSNGLCIDYNITVITIIDTKPFYELNKNVNVIPCVNTTNIKKSFINSLKSNYGLYKKIKDICKDESIDILIGFMTSSNVLAILAARRSKIPVIISERNHPSFSGLSKFWKIMRRITYPKANILVVQTKPILDFFSSYVKKENLKILANPIAKDHVDAKNTVIVEKENIILNVGSLNYQKGQDIAIKAFARINPVDWQLHLVGEGPKKEEYKNLIKELRMENKILLIGRDNKISKYYLRSRVFIFPSRFEGFPNALTEAMYMGLPCISSDCPTGPSELIEEGQNGFLSPIDNVKMFADKLNILINDSSLRQELGINASKSVTQYEEKNITKIWKELISKTIQKNNRIILKGMPQN